MRVFSRGVSPTFQFTRNARQMLSRRCRALRTARWYTPVDETPLTARDYVIFKCRVGGGGGGAWFGGIFFPFVLREIRYFSKRAADRFSITAPIPRFHYLPTRFLRLPEKAKKKKNSYTTRENMRAVDNIISTRRRRESIDFFLLFPIPDFE